MKLDVLAVGQEAMAELGGSGVEALVELLDPEVVVTSPVEDEVIVDDGIIDEMVEEESETEDEDGEAEVDDIPVSASVNPFASDRTEVQA